MCSPPPVACFHAEHEDAFLYCGQIDCKRWWESSFGEMQQRRRHYKVAHEQNTRCFLLAGHVLMHTEQIAWAYHPTTKPSISPWLLYHSPMSCLMKFRKNLWPNPHISHLVWDPSQILHCGQCKQIMTLWFYQAAELYTAKHIWSFRSGSFSDRHITFRISIYEKFNSVRL